MAGAQKTRTEKYEIRVEMEIEIRLCRAVTDTVNTHTS